jgi:CheY-like chemotaxis protein
MTDYSKKRFLVIDDQPQARDALRTVAQTLGAFAVEFASNYQDAIYRIRNNTPDIILCDYMLGEGRSGQQLLEELRRFKLLQDETHLHDGHRRTVLRAGGFGRRTGARRLHHQTVFTGQAAAAPGAHRCQEKLFCRLLPAKA